MKIILYDGTTIKADTVEFASNGNKIIVNEDSTYSLEHVLKIVNDKRYRPVMTDYWKMNDYADMDCYDNTFDIDGVAVCWNGESEEDEDYDRVIEYIMDNTFVDHIINSISLSVDWTAFVKRKMEQWEQFTHEVNNPSYDMTEYNDEDDKIVVAIRTINNLIAGYYSDSDYTIFCEIFGVEEV